jgi:cytosine deaminase
MDLIIRNANLPDGRIGIDIGIKDGKIAALEVALTAKAEKEIDAYGYLVSPPFESVRNFAGRHSLVG